jgi:hypothetical protein
MERFMKKLSLTLLTLFAATLLVACSEDDSGPAPAPIGPAVVPTPTPGPTGDGFTTWESNQWNGSVANPSLFGKMLTGGTAGLSGINGFVCYSDGNYALSGRRDFFGNQDCENYQNRAFIRFRYNPSNNQAQIFVYGNCTNPTLCGQGGLIAGFSRESTASYQYNGLYVDFGPLIISSGDVPMSIVNFRVFVSSNATSANVTDLPISISFGLQSGSAVLTDNLKRK